MVHRHLDPQMRGEGGQAVVGQTGQEEVRQVTGVVDLLAAAYALGVQHGRVEAGEVAADEHAPIDKGLHVRGHDLQRGSVLDVGRADAGQGLDAVGYGLTGVDEGGEAVDDAVAGEPDGADLHDGVRLGIEAGGLEIQGNVGAGQTAVIVAPRAREV